MKKMQFLPVIVIMILLITVFQTGCTNNENKKETQTITDMLGRSVKVPVDVEKVVGIEAGALRLLVYLECTSKVVGVEESEFDEGRPYAYAYAKLQDLPSIGPIHGGDAELIVAQQPDVIFWTYTTKEDVDELQQKTNIPVVAIDYGDLSDNRDTFYSALRLVGKVMGKDNRAEDFITFIDGTISDLNNRTKDIFDTDKPSCYMGGIGYRGAHGILSTEPTYSPFRFVNAKNAVVGVGSDHAFIDKEKLIEWNPDIIFVDEGGYSLIIEDFKDASYDTLDAKKNGDVYGVLPYNWYTANMGTILANAYYIGTVLYPDEFKDIDPEKKADEIYEEMVGAGVYDDMKSYFGGFKKVDS